MGPLFCTRCTPLAHWLDSSAGVLCAAGRPPGTPLGGRLCELGDAEFDRLDRLHRHGLAEGDDISGSTRLVLERLGPYATRTLRRVLGWGSGVRLWPEGRPDGALGGNALHWLAGSVAPGFVGKHYGSCDGCVCGDWLREYGVVGGELETQWRLLRAHGASDTEPNEQGHTPLDILEASPLGSPLLAENAMARMSAAGAPVHDRRRA